MVKSEAKLDKDTLAVVFYLISRLDGILGKTHLQKLLFLSDILAMRRLKEKITVMEYKKYLHGPFTVELDNYTNHLSNIGYIEIKKFPLTRKETKSYTRYYLKKEVSIKEQLLKSLGPEKLLIIDEVVDSFGNLSLQNLLDIVYKLPIVQESKRDDILDVAKKTESEPEEKEDLPF